MVGLQSLITNNIPIRKRPVIQPKVWHSEACSYENKNALQNRLEPIAEN